MSFLACTPTVFVIGDCYEILLYALAPGLFSLRIGGELYYEESSGVLSSESAFLRIRVPQAALDTAGEYTVLYRKTALRRSYFSLFEEEESATFPFSPVRGEGEVRLYFVSDLHYHYTEVMEAATYFGEALDLLIVGGDLGEMENERNYLDACRFLGEVTGGRIPVIMARGNHDTRGRLAERFTDHFPANGKKTYYTFRLAAFSGVVLDCGEDKWDNHIGSDGPVYNGTNIFERYRREETAFLRTLELPKDRPLIAISHIAPSMTTTEEKGEVFDIERETYAEWNRELARLGISVMLSGHLHRLFVLTPGDARATSENPYPVIVGAATDRTASYYIGTAVTLRRDGLTYRFTDRKHAVLGEGEIGF